MDTLNSPRQAATRPRSRKSITHIPSTDATSDKENLTVDTAGLASVPTQSTSRVKKSRSKSIGPGGLDALYSDAGNRRKVDLHPVTEELALTDYSPLRHLSTSQS